MLISPRIAVCALSVCSPLLLAGVAGAQSGFGGQEVISDVANRATSVYATDLDGDGDADVLSASTQEKKIAWYENVGPGNGVNGGAFGVPQEITAAADNARSVYATDLDGDGDADVLSASVDDNKIAWYENRGGGVFGAQQVITTAADGARSVYATDLDGDGDADVLSASYRDDKIAWYENVGPGSGVNGGAFGSQQVITTAAAFATSVYATDLDGDGDADVLSASENDDKVAWYENVGPGNGVNGGAFGSQQVITAAADNARSVYATDLDGDGNADVLSASHDDNRIAWYENVGPGNGVNGGAFGVPQEITNAVDAPHSVYATDLDGDGHADVLSASYSDNKIAWYENQIPQDCNSNGVDDGVELAAGTALDCNANGQIDSCEITTDPALDLDLNGILDSCEVSGPYWFRSPITQRLMTVLPPTLYGSARADATVLGGTLATIRSAAENDWLQGILPGDPFWIGYNDATVEGTFMWHSQETPGYENWEPGAPGNFTSDQDYVAFKPSDGTWDTWFLNSVYRAVVESDEVDCDGDLVLDNVQIQNDPSLDMNGDGQLDSCIPPSYCTGNINSSGEGGSIHALGSPVLSANGLTLRAIDLPDDQWSFFLMSQNQTSVPNFGGSQGVLCVGAPIVRFNMSGTGQVDKTTAGGTRTYAVDFQNLPQAIVFQPGDTWNFQLWFRDVNPPPTVTSNTTNGVTVMFR